jgi:hypothetical protein
MVYNRYASGIAIQAPNAPHARNASCQWKNIGDQLAADLKRIVRVSCAIRDGATADETASASHKLCKAVQQALYHVQSDSFEDRRLLVMTVAGEDVVATGTNSDCSLTEATAAMRLSVHLNHARYGRPLYYRPCRTGILTFEAKDSGSEASTSESDADTGSPRADSVTMDAVESVTTGTARATRNTDSPSPSTRYSTTGSEKEVDAMSGVTRMSYTGAASGSVSFDALNHFLNCHALPVADGSESRSTEEV